MVDTALGSVDKNQTSLFRKTIMHAVFHVINIEREKLRNQFNCQLNRKHQKVLYIFTKAKYGISAAETYFMSPKTQALVPAWRKKGLLCANIISAIGFVQRV